MDCEIDQKSYELDVRNVRQKRKLICSQIIMPTKGFFSTLNEQVIYSWSLGDLYECVLMVNFVLIPSLLYQIYSWLHIDDPFLTTTINTVSYCNNYNYTCNHYDKHKNECLQIDNKSLAIKPFNRSGLKTNTCNTESLYLSSKFIS